MRLLILTQKVDRNDSILGFFHRWIEEFAKHCDSVIVVALGVREYDLPKNVRVFSLGKESGVSRLKYIFNFYRLMWRERKNYDVVFVHMNPVYVILGGILWRMWGKSVALWYTHKHVDFKLRVAEKLSNVIFTASAKSFRLKSAKVQVMGHGIDVNVFEPSRQRERERFHLLTVGRISPVKDYETLISAATLLKKEGTHFSVEIVGAPATREDGVYNESLQSLVRRKGLEGVVNFVPPVANRELPKLLQSSDVFINMSNTGSLDKAVLEAMACGVPVITSNEAFKEIFGGDVKMLMFQSGDARSLSKKIKEVNFLKQTEKEELTKRLRNVIVKKHNIEVLIPHILAFYETSR